MVWWPGSRQPPVVAFLEVLATVAADGRECDHPAFFRLLRNGYLLAYQDDEHDWYRPHPWLGELGQP